jgi:hypothetical protein
VGDRKEVLNPLWYITVERQVKYRRHDLVSVNKLAVMLKFNSILKE